MKTIKDKQLLVGADFAGYPLKEAVCAHLRAKGWTITDVGVTDPGVEDTENMFHRIGLRVGAMISEGEFERALIFCGKFQGDKAAKDYLKSLGFTLTGNNGTVSKSSEMSEALRDGYVKEDPDAYLFELYLIRSFEKNSSDKTAYTEEFSATARATFKNGGTQDSGPKDSETKDSKTQHLSFQKAWQNALDPNSDMKQEDRDILQNFLNAFGITI